jgi:hypothetical protein
LPGMQRYQKKYIFVLHTQIQQSMENKNTSVFYNGLIWGLIIGFAGIIYQVILYMLNQNLNQAFGYLGILITLVLLILGMRSFRDKIRGGVLPFSTAFGFGIVAIVVSGILGTIYGYILWTVIDPDIITRMMEMKTDKLLQRGLPEEAIDQGMNITSKFMRPGIMAVMGLGSSLLFGAILSLIVGAIMKRDEPQDAVAAEEDSAS